MYGHTSSAENMHAAFERDEEANAQSLNHIEHTDARACVRARACLEPHSRGGRVSHDPLVFGELIVEKKRISPVHLAHVTSSCA
jgi:hypothetical protein